jgi:hypothetical protein
MAEGGLFRVLSTHDGTGKPSPATPDGCHRACESDFLSGVSLMITAEGKSVHAALNRRTRKIRQTDWQDEHGKVEPGTWMRSDA